MSIGSSKSWKVRYRSDNETEMTVIKEFLTSEPVSSGESAVQHEHNEIQDVDIHLKGSIIYNITTVD